MSNFYTSTELTQLAGARDQLETAIYLFLLGASPASVHTLVGAAQEVLKGLVRRQSRDEGQASPLSILDEYSVDAVGPGAMPLNSTRNFLKHFLGQPAAKVQLHTYQNVLWILDCIQSYWTLNQEYSDAMCLFRLWFFSRHIQSYFCYDCDEEFRKEIMEEAGLEYPVPNVLHYGPWLRNTLSQEPALAVPEWVRAAA